MYTPDELTSIQDGIDEMMSLRTAAPERRNALIEAQRQGAPGNPFLPLALDKPDLHARVMADPMNRKFGIVAFLPQTAPLVFDSSTSPVYTPLRGTRGPVVRFTHPDGDFIIKPYQSTDERTIAPLVGELGIGPKQFPSLKHLMTEEFVSGTPTTELRGPEVAQERMLAIGRQLGEFFKTLHEKNIFYNDMINDDFGKSHVIAKPNGDVRLIDFGVALDLTDPSQFTDEQVWNYLRTLPEMGMFWDGSAEQAEGIVAMERERVRSLTSPQIISRQRELIYQSLGLLASRMGNEPVQSLARGFEENYGDY